MSTPSKRGWLRFSDIREKLHVSFRSLNNAVQRANLDPSGVCRCSVNPKNRLYAPENVDILQAYIANAAISTLRKLESSREIAEVFHQWYAEGKTDMQMASLLGVSKFKVRSYRQQVGLPPQEDCRARGGLVNGGRIRAEIVSRGWPADITSTGADILDMLGVAGTPLSTEEIRADSGRCLNRVQAVLRRLRQKGLITLQREKGHTGNKYILSWDAISILVSRARESQSEKFVPLAKELPCLDSL